MKRTVFLLAAAAALFGFSAFDVLKVNGVAGYTGSPGESTCATAGCHSGGVSASKGITITSVPSFSNNEYMRDSTYTISVLVSASGFNYYGVGAEIIDSTGQNSGTITTLMSAGVKILYYAGRANVVHTAPKFGAGGTQFNFMWQAPSEGAATLYVAGNAVNNNNNSLGDIPMNTSLSLSIAPLPPDTSHPNTDGINEYRSAVVTKPNVFPNPARHLFQVNYDLRKQDLVKVELCDQRGAVIKQISQVQERAGNHFHFVDVQDIPDGLYFVSVQPGSHPAVRIPVCVNH
jgi:hypothetical protein